MNYKEAIRYLYESAPMFQKIGSKAYKEGLENTLVIDSRFHHPHTGYRSIHVAGTNGKGSISHLLASILQEAGYKVGLYTSPHLTDFRERIRINGTLIPQSFVADFITENQVFFQELQPSFFELTTGMAFYYFAEEQVDVAVIETGLGGRLDCTNIIYPDLSVITNISFDHTHLLGNTLPLIAKEKAGIIKFEVPVVIGEASEDVKQVFIDEAEKKNAPIVFAEEEKPIIRSISLPSGKWLLETREYPDIIDELGGFVQKKNAATVLCAIKKLKQAGYKIADSAVCRGFACVVNNTGLQGRWQVAGIHPKIVLDTGHNVAGMTYIVQQLKVEKYERLHLVIGMVNDKDITGILQLLPDNAVYYFTQASVPRALDAGQLAKEAEKSGLHGNVYSTVKEAFYAAKQTAKKNDFIFVGGSTFVVADALEVINEY